LPALASVPPSVLAELPPAPDEPPIPEEPPVLDVPPFPEEPPLPIAPPAPEAPVVEVPPWPLVALDPAEPPALPPVPLVEAPAEPVTPAPALAPPEPIGGIPELSDPPHARTTSCTEAKVTHRNERSTVAICAPVLDKERGLEVGIPPTQPKSPQSASCPIGVGFSNRTDWPHSRWPCVKATVPTSTDNVHRSSYPRTVVVTGVLGVLLFAWLGFLVHRSPRFPGSGVGGMFGIAGAVLMLIPF